MAKKYKSQKTKEKFERLMSKHGHLLDMPASCLPVEHKANLGGGLRCFQRVWQRDEDDNTIKLTQLPKRRCGKPAVKGSFFCKTHGGGNQHRFVHGKQANPIRAAYRKAFNSDMGDLLEAFLDDPKIMDIRPELGALRIALVQHLEQLASGKPMSNPTRMCDWITGMLEDDSMTDLEKFVKIKEYCNKTSTLTDGESLDRLARIIETIGRIMERAHKMETKDEFVLTPEGLKIMLRSITEIIHEHVVDEVVKGNMRQALLDISLKTKGDLSQLRQPAVVEAKFKEIK